MARMKYESDETQKVSDYKTLEMRIWKDSGFCREGNKGHYRVSRYSGLTFILEQLRAGLFHLNAVLITTGVHSMKNINFGRKILYMKCSITTMWEQMCYNSGFIMWMWIDPIVDLY